MRYFTTKSASLQVIRKVGFYPSDRVARKVADALAYVLESDKAQRNVIECMLKFGITPERTQFGRFTVAEERVIHDFLDWYTVDTVTHLREKSFVAANLNVGRCLVFQAQSTVSLAGDLKRASWTTADEADVESV